MVVTEGRVAIRAAVIMAMARCYFLCLILKMISGRDMGDDGAGGGAD